MKKIIPSAIKIAPSIRENFPSMPRIIGTKSIIKYKILFRRILLFTFIPFEETNATIPKIKVKSVMFPPSKVPTPSSGSPLIAEKIAIVVSGKAEITAIIKKLTTNCDK
jgi:hypothetical protein